MSKEIYLQNLENNLRDLTERVQSGRYRPGPKREVLIPKPNGGNRPIAIASLEDKIVDRALGEILSLIYEPVFIRDSYGYRPRRSAHQAVEMCYKSMERGTRPFVMEIDFSNFFNTISHRELMTILRRRIADERFLSLIRRLLTGEILRVNGKLEPSFIGTPQGGIASPILANIYLNQVLDQWFTENYQTNGNIMVRYADDAVFLFRKEEDLRNFEKGLRLRMTQYSLVVNEEKTHTIKLDKKSCLSFTFLGFTFYWRKQGRRRIFKLKTSKKTLIRAIKSFYQWVKSNRNHYKLLVLWEKAKSKISGHVNYFGYWMNSPKVNHFIWEAERSLYKWLNRRSQKKSYNWEGFRERLKYFPLTLPLDKIKWRHIGHSFGRI